MTGNQEKYAKILRQSIMAIAVKRYGWNYDEFHEIMQDWGFGNSLRVLSISELKDLKNQLNGQLNGLSSTSKEWELDDQGKLMWFLMKSIGWNRQRITLLLLKKFKKTHWNLLSEKEKRRVINILKSYAKKRKNINKEE